MSDLELSEDTICRKCGHELKRHTGPQGPCCADDMDPESMGCPCWEFELKTHQ